MKKISAEIAASTDKEDSVAVMGSEPQVFFYAKRISATGYIYMYPLMERNDFASAMQVQAIKQIEKAKPKVIEINTANNTPIHRNPKPCSI